MAQLVIAFVCASFFVTLLQATPEPGLWVTEVTKDHSKVMFTKSLYKDTNIKVKLVCPSAKQNDEKVVKVAVQYAGRMTQCHGEFNDIDDERVQASADEYIKAANQKIIDNERVLYFIASKSWQDCDDSIIILKDHGTADWITSSANVTKLNVNQETKKQSGNVAKSSTESAPRRRRAAQQQSESDIKNQPVHVANSSVMRDYSDLHRIAVAKEDGIYLFAFTFECAFFNKKTGKIDTNDRSCDFLITMTIEMNHDYYGFLSALDWPELPFYATMCGIYGVFALTWLSLCLYYWRDLIRLQFWIAGVIFLGLIEKSIFLAEYQAVYSTGLSVLPGALVVAEIVSASKRTLARILIVIVSVGFGIVRPRLGPVLNRVLLLGAFYFIFATVEGCLRQLHPKGDNSTMILGSVLPLALIDAILCCWVFTALVQTIRQLRVRRNVAKLALYKHFTNILIFAVLVSLVFMVWSAAQHKFVKCLVDWRELWMDDAFWQMLFSTILLVIIILFRPSNNTVKYSFQPLVDNDDDNDDAADLDEVIMTNLANDVKKKQRSNDRSSERENGKMVANSVKDNDDLKWVEENIPIADGALPSLLDSDEEIMASNYERNKME